MQHKRSEWPPDNLVRTDMVLAVLRALDAARDQLRWQQSKLDRVLNDSLLADDFDDDVGEDERALAHLRQAWAAFRQVGGVTADDWQRWLDGKPIDRLRQTGRNKRHLRVVASRPTYLPLRMRKHLCGSDGDAA
jgi:hypothetical protein